MESDCRCRGPVYTGGLMQEPAPGQPSFYRRQLPAPPAIDFASEEGKEIFSQALTSGTLAGFFPLIAQFQTQAEPAYCGLASLSVTLNALSIDPKRPWKGPWRWFDEALLDCCEPLEKVKLEGIVFRKLACLARCQGVGVRSVLASCGSETGFRDAVRRAATGGNAHVIVGYSRKEFSQTGDGHFSPVGGYHAARDLVLILDVARFKYPPHWVPLSLLWKAMNRVDKVTGESRGYLVLTPREKPAAALFSLARPDSKWAAVADYAAAGAAAVLHAAADVSTAEQALCAVLEKLPDDVTHLLTWMRTAAPAGEDAQVPRDGQLAQGVKDQVLRQLRSSRLFGLVSKWVAAQSERPLDTRAGILTNKNITNGVGAHEKELFDDAGVKGATSAYAHAVSGRKEGAALKRKRTPETVTAAEAESVVEMGTVTETVTGAQAEVEAELAAEGEAETATTAIEAEAKAEVEKETETEIETETETKTERETVRPVKGARVKPSNSAGPSPDELGPSDGVPLGGVDPNGQVDTDSLPAQRSFSEPGQIEPESGRGVGPGDGMSEISAGKTLLEERRQLLNIDSEAGALRFVERAGSSLAGTEPDMLGNGIENSTARGDWPAETPAVDGPTRVDLLVVLLLVCPSEVWAAARDARVREELQSLTNTCCMEPPLHDEIAHLKEQYKALRSDWTG